MRKETSKKDQTSDDIAVIGMNGRFPGARNIEEFWENLKKGRETISHFSNKELEEGGISPEILKNPHYIKAKGIVQDVDSFDADFFSYPPREAERMDPQIRILHECSWEALEKAGYNPECFKGSVGVFFGANENREWLKRVEAWGGNPSENFDSFLLNYRDYVSTRISFKLNLKGPSVTLLSACSTSLVSIHLACQALKNGECDMAIAGGVSLSFPQKSGYLYLEGLMVSADGHCKAFDDSADGTVFGDGVGVVVLKSLKQALRDRDYIHAIIKGSAVNNDGNGKIGFTAPSAEGQGTVIRAACREAGVEPESIGYIEAHGTGTRLGDPIEIEALKQAFRTEKRAICRIGSVKTNIGHVNIAAGVSSFIKTVLCLKYRMIPPSLHFKTPNPDIDLENSPFSVNTRLTIWTTNGYPRRAGVSAFGFGGTNAHMILEEALPQKPAGSSRPSQLIMLSAKTRTALEKTTKNLAGYLKKYPGINLADVAYTLATGRKHFQYRRIFVAGSVEEALSSQEALHSSCLQDWKERSMIFMFPGQGSQYVGMGEGLYRSEPTFRHHVDRCAEILKSHLKTDIRKILHSDKCMSEETTQELNKTAIAQTAVFTISYSMAKLWMDWGVIPRALIGHSIGEFVAACLAGVFSLEDALYLVARRGQLMQKMPGGRMLAVSLSEKEIRSFLKEEISLAAVNGPSLCVLSGRNDPVEELKKHFSKRRIASRYLPASHAFHSKMMEPILDEFTQLGEQVPRKEPRIPMMSTVTGNWLSASEITNPEYWSRNLRQAVHFSSAIQKLLEDSDNIFLEVGPGRTLCNLTRMHSDLALKRIILPSVRGAQESRPDEAFLLDTLGKLWLAGVVVDWPGFYKHEKRYRVPLPTYPFERQKFWTGPHMQMDLSSGRWDLLSKNSDMAEWFSVPSWRRSVMPHFERSAKKKKICWLVFMDRCGLGARIVNKLKKNGQNVVVVYAGNRFTKHSETRYTVNPGKQNDYGAFFNDLSRLNKLPQKIIHLWSVTRNDQSILDFKAVDKSQHLGFFSLLFLAQVIGTQNITDKVHVSVVSNNIHEVTGGEPIAADKATVLGPVKVIPQEFPNINCCNIDVILPPKGSANEKLVIDQVLFESLTNLNEPVVAYRGEYRWVQTFERLRLQGSSKKRMPLRKEGTYLITGGLGGIGLVLAGYLGKAFKAKLIITGRSAFPARSRWQKWLESHDKDDQISQKIRKIRKIEFNGAKVFVVTADITDQKKMENEITKVVRQTGPIHGIVHAAGLPGEGIIQLKKYDIAKNIIAPKVKGTLVLDNLFKDKTLDFFVLCSSIASVLGGIGLVDYCAANSFLDAFAVARRSGLNGSMLSINWDMWGEVGMGLRTHMPDELRGWLEKELRDGITSKEGIDVFQRVLSWGGGRNIIVSTRDLQPRIDLWVKREFVKEKESLMEEKASKPKYMRPSLSTDYVAPATDIERKVAAIWGKLFGIEKVGRHDNFYELGGHSLLATTLVNKLKKEFNTTLSIRDILDRPVVSELSGLIEKSARKRCA